jgi:pimeloyl-ACP methyl ester carboxylesterase
MSQTQTASKIEQRDKGGELETLIVDGRRIAYQDVGRGPTVILAHCSSATHKAWAPLVAALRPRYRVVAPDLHGYGQSDRWPTLARLHPWSDVKAIVRLAETSGHPVHLVGHSYGGTVALEAARALGPRVRSLTLIEPVAFHLLREASRMREWREVTEVGRRLTEALRLRKERRAAGIYMKYWVGVLPWLMMPRKTRRHVVDTIGKVGSEFETILYLNRTESDYRSIHAPTRLIAGERTRTTARAIVDLLANILPDAHVDVLDRAGHMSPITHPAAVTKIVTGHIDVAEARASQTLFARRISGPSRAMETSQRRPSPFSPRTR